MNFFTQRGAFGGLAVLVAAALSSCEPTSQRGQPATYTYQVVHTYQHDRTAFTEGLFYFDGFLYESTGEPSRSSIRKVKIETGEVARRYDLPDAFFGEGIVQWKDRIIGLTYQTEVGFLYDLASFQPRREFHYSGEGWGLTQDGHRIYMSDGTPQIRIWDPETLRELSRITVTDQGAPVKRVNELEWVKGEIYANIWLTERIARIDPTSGVVLGWVEMSGLLNPGDRVEGPLATDWLNGIAYDARADRLFVTGKRWSKLFEVRLVKRTP